MNNLTYIATLSNLFILFNRIYYMPLHGCGHGIRLPSIHSQLFASFDRSSLILGKAALQLHFVSSFEMITYYSSFDANTDRKAVYALQ